MSTRALAGARRVTLIRPDGSRGRTCGPYCDDHTDSLLRVPVHPYTGGGDARVVETLER